MNGTRTKNDAEETISRKIISNLAIEHLPKGKLMHSTNIDEMLQNVAKLNKGIFIIYHIVA